MGLASATAEITYTGTNALSTYAYTFKVFLNTQLQLVVRRISTGVETVLALTTDYTVTGVLGSSGGNIVLVNASQAWLTGGFLASTYKLTIRRVVALTQITDIRNQGDFYPETHEDEFDLLTMQDQQQQTQIDRAVRLPRTKLPADFDPTIPALYFETVENLLFVNSSMNGFSYGTTTTAISASEAAALASQIAAAASSASATASAAAALASELAAAASGAASSASAAASAIDAAASAADAVAAALSAAAAAGSLPDVTGTRASPSLIVAGTGIAFTGVFGRNLWFVAGSGSAVDISASPQIVAGTNIGQELTLIGRSATDTVQLDDGNGLSMNGTAILGLNDSITFYWDGTSWVEINRRS